MRLTWHNAERPTRHEAARNFVDGVRVSFHFLIVALATSGSPFLFGFFHFSNAVIRWSSRGSQRKIVTCSEVTEIWKWSSKISGPFPIKRGSRWKCCTYSHLYMWTKNHKILVERRGPFWFKRVYSSFRPEDIGVMSYNPGALLRLESWGDQGLGPNTGALAKGRAGCWVQEGPPPSAVRVREYVPRKIFWKLRC